MPVLRILQAVRFVRLDSKMTRSVLPLVELAQHISKWRRHKKNCGTRRRMLFMVSWCADRGATLGAPEQR